MGRGHADQQITYSRSKEAVTEVSGKDVSGAALLAIVIFSG